MDRPVNNLKGAALMAAAGCFFAVEAIFVRIMLARGIPVSTQVLARCLGQIVWLLPYLAVAGANIFHTRRWPMHLLRGGSSVLTWTLYFLAFAYLDLATATVLSFTNVMFTTMLAGPLLGERVGRARWAGTIAGLLGVAVMLRPGTDISIPGAAIAIGAAITWCGITVTTRSLTRTDSTGTILAWVAVITTTIALPLAIWGWKPLNLGDAMWLAAFGCTTPAIIWLLTESLRAGEASAVAPFQYLRLIIIAALGWLLYAEIPDRWAFVGAGFILAGAIVVTIAEARRR